MTKKVFRVLILILSFSLSACHSLVEDEFENFEPVPVLNGLLQADSIMRVQISLTANLTDSTPKYVDNALVIIESTAKGTDTLIYTTQGWYVSSRQAKSGETYTCKVFIEGFPMLSAVTTVPETTNFDSIVFTEFAGRGTEGEKISSVEFRIPNDITKKQFWEVQLVTQSTRFNVNQQTNELNEYSVNVIEQIYMIPGQDSVLLSEANPLTVFSNKKMKSNFYIVKFYINESFVNLRYRDAAYIVLKSIDESFYKFIKQYYIYDTAGWISIGKSPQRYPLHSNIKNGMGIFTGISAVMKKIEINIPKLKSRPE